MQDRNVEFPNRYRMTKVAGTDDIYDLVPAPGTVETEGDYLNKKTLLSDDVAEKFGLPPATTVPNDILSVLSGSALAVNAPKYKEHTTLEGIPVGTVIQLNEDGAPVDFYVAKHDYESDLNGAGRTLLVRKDCYDTRVWHSSDVNAYASSDIDAWLNDGYKALLDEDIREAMGATKFYYTPGNGSYGTATLERAVFLLAGSELGQSHTYMNMEGFKLSIASSLQIAYLNGSAVAQWTRSPHIGFSTLTWYSDSAGSLSSNSCSATYGSRPAFTLPATFPYTWYEDAFGNVYTEQEYELQLADVLGNLLTIPARQIKDNVKIEAGSYIGTGTYGADNPNTLTFSFEPKMVIVAYRYDRDDYIYAYAAGIMFFQRAIISLTSSSGAIGSGVLAVPGWRHALEWFSTVSAEAQGNRSDATYHYLAIG